MSDDDHVSKADMNAFWVMFGGILVFFMQGGFAMLEVGSVQAKNTKNILVKNVADAAVGALCWWLIGWGIAFGNDSNEINGATQVVQCHPMCVFLVMNVY
jgi:Amt family ammonium transporter